MSQPAVPEPSGGTRPDQPGQPFRALAATRTARPLAAAARVVLIAAVVAGLGAPLGLLWSALSPAVPVRMTGRGPVFGESQPEQVIAAEGWFALLGLLFGVLVAVAGWLAVPASRGIPGLLAVTAGGLVAGLLAWWLGARIGLADYQAALAAAEPGDQLFRPPDLRVAQAGWWPPWLRGLPVVPSLAAAGTYTMLAAWSRFPSLRPEQDPHPPQLPDRDDSTIRAAPRLDGC